MFSNITQGRYLLPIKYRYIYKYSNNNKNHFFLKLKIRYIFNLGSLFVITNFLSVCMNVCNAYAVTIRSFAYFFFRGKKGKFLLIVHRVKKGLGILMKP